MTGPCTKSEIHIYVCEDEPGAWRAQALEIDMASQAGSGFDALVVLGVMLDAHREAGTAARRALDPHWELWSRGADPGLGLADVGRWYVGSIKLLVLDPDELIMMPVDTF